MEHALIQKIALIGALGLGAQWLAWRLHLPAIALLAVAGILVGPVLGWLRPAEDFGELLRPLVAAAVAVILFEGGLNLNRKELREVGPVVRRLIILGVPLGWLFGAAAAHYVLGLAWPVALLFGGILVVTGPTVIVPLLRQAKLARQPAWILKWEGIINDPIGALLAVVTFRYVTSAAAGVPWVAAIVLPSLAVVAAAGLGFVAGRLFAWAFDRGYVVEFLKGPAILGLVLVCYAAGNLLQAEAGLIAVTVLGATLANTALTSIDQMRRLKEYLAVLLVSAVFIVLTASLEPGMLSMLDWRTMAFLAVLLFAVRPAAVMLATAGTGADWRHKVLAGWTAPRGVIAVALSSLFAPVLVDHGYPEAALLLPVSFAVVFTTVIVHGFSVPWLARRLGLASGPEHGVLIVGANPWTTRLALALNEREVPVMLSDVNWHHLRGAVEAGVPIFYGEILSELAEHRLDLNRFDHLVAATDNDAYNALVCTQFAPEFGRNRVFQLAGQEGDEDDPHAFRHRLRGQTLLDAGLGYDELVRRASAGWRFQAFEVSGKGEAGLPMPGGRQTERIALVRRAGEVVFRTPEQPFEPREGDVLVVFAAA